MRVSTPRFSQKPTRKGWGEFEHSEPQIISDHFEDDVSPSSSKRTDETFAPPPLLHLCPCNHRVLLEEARSNKGDNKRYKAALNGESLGTHTTGTTMGAKAVE
mmetsp:Transcript_3331/g.9297  ORF Transcript_3331/g.9297 Transcript_3331/m.9297 type:complete len:103 (-) Transcript_3331:151-459(-)